MTTTLLNNRYQTIQVLGAGGFGETFLAEDTYMPSRRRCVIKQLKPVTNNPQMYQLIQQRFQREAATLESLGDGSDQIPKLYAYFSENGQFYLVQEWIPGHTLGRKVATEGPLDESAVREILVSLLQVLDYVHSKRIIYRDIKPDNIILSQISGKPVLIDFGAVKETMTTTVNFQGKTTYSIVLGTPGFMAPEQAAGRPIYASDIYSLGMTAIYLLTGKLPQELDTDSQTDEILWQRYALNVSPSLVAVLNQAIQYHPRDRYTTAMKMLEALHSVTSIPSHRTLTQATVAVSAAAGKQPRQPALVNSLQPAPVINYPDNHGWRKALIGSLLAGSLIGVAVVVGFTRNHSPQSAVTSPRSRSISESPVAITPFPKSPIRASEPATKPSAAVTAPAPSPVIPTLPQDQETAPSPPPSVGAAPQPEDEQVTTQSPSPTPAAPQPVNENPHKPATNVNKNIPAFPTGTSESKVKAALGNPTSISRGIWSNTRAMLYDIKPNQITLGYLVDRNSGQIRQTEVAFAQSVSPEVMQATLQQMLDNRAFINASLGLQRVYQRRANSYSFNAGGLKGVIERNNRDRIYIGVWDAELH